MCLNVFYINCTIDFSSAGLLVALTMSVPYFVDTASKDMCAWMEFGNHDLCCIYYIYIHPLAIPEVTYS